MDEPTLYCEFLGGDHHQLINTVSSIAFVLAAFAIYRFVRHSQNQKVLGTFLAALIFLIGVGSGWWHYTNSVSGDLLDTIFIGLYTLVAAYIIVSALTQRSLYRFILLSTLATSSFFIEQLPYLNGSLVYVFLFLVLSGSLYKIQGVFSKNLGIIMGLLMFAVTARSLDIEMCAVSVIGSHFLWHVFAAAGLYFLSKELVDIRSTIANH